MKLFHLSQFLQMQHVANPSLVALTNTPGIRISFNKFLLDKLVVKIITLLGTNMFFTFRAF